MRIHIIGATVILSLCGVPLQAAAQSVCVKPWTIPDKWTDNHDVTEPIDQIWDLGDTFETVDAHGTPLPDADVYQPGAGFSIADVGQRVWLKVKDSGTSIQVAFSPSTSTARAVAATRTEPRLRPGRAIRPRLTCMWVTYFRC
jgi:hypothetical protein